MFCSPQLSCEFKHTVKWDIKHCSGGGYHSTPDLRTPILVQHRGGRDPPQDFCSFTLIQGVASVFYPATMNLGGGSTVSAGLGGASVCSDTSEGRDVVVLLQHGQGSGVQVVGQACAAPTAISPARAVHRRGGGVPRPAGGGFKGTCGYERWRDRTRWRKLLVEFLLQVMSELAASKHAKERRQSCPPPPTCSTVVLRGPGRRVASIATQGAVGAGAGRPPLTGGLFPIALERKNTPPSQLTAKQQTR